MRWLRELTRASTLRARSIRARLSGRAASIAVRRALTRARGFGFARSALASATPRIWIDRVTLVRVTGSAISAC
jgi:hypothetical protein